MIKVLKSNCVSDYDNDNDNDRDAKGIFYGPVSLTSERLLTPRRTPAALWAGTPRLINAPAARRFLCHHKGLSNPSRFPTP